MTGMLDGIVKTIVADSDLAHAAAKPLADAQAAMALTVKAAQAWQVAFNSFEALLAAYGVQVEKPK